MAATTRTRRKAAPEPVVEADDAFEDLDDVDEIDDDTEDEVDEAPTPKRGRRAATKAAKAPAEKPAGTKDELGSVWLAEHVTEVTGESYDSRSIRMLLRKVAKDEDGPLAREIGTDRTRYTFRGPNDPVVRHIVKMVKSGAAKAVRREGLEKVKNETAAKRTRKAAAEPVEEPVEEASARRTRRTATKAAPAKAAPARRRTRSANAEG